MTKTKPKQKHVCKGWLVDPALKVASPAAKVKKGRRSKKPAPQTSASAPAERLSGRKPSKSSTETSDSERNDEAAVDDGYEADYFIEFKEMLDQLLCCCYSFIIVFFVCFLYEGAYFLILIWYIFWQNSSEKIKEAEGQQC